MTDPTPAEYRDTLAAVLDAIDPPHAATQGDEERRNELVAHRAIHTAVCLRALLDEPDARPRGWTLDHLRDVADRHPVDYRTDGGDAA